jgi:lipopolysaccharide heptosyltransferase II
MAKRDFEPLSELRPSRVCVIKPSALGDIVQSLPVLSALRARWPEAHLAWVVNRPLVGIFERQPDLNQVIPFDRAASGLGRIAAIGNLAGELRRGRFDLTIDLQGLLRSGLMTLATAAPRRVGFADAREGATLAYTDRITVATRQQSAVDINWLMAQAFGCTGSPPTVKLGTDPLEIAWAERALVGLPRPILAIHPGAQWETKRWPAASFLELARRSHAEFGGGVVLLGGPDDVAIGGELAKSLTGPSVNLAGRTSLLELAAVSGAADVFLSGDSGPMHLAAAVGTRVVAVFTCTSPVRARPYGSGHRVVATCVSCAASYVKTCPTLHCMLELSPDRVWPELARALSEAVARRQAG